MATVDIYNWIRSLLNSNVKRYGALDSPTSITYGGEVYEVTKAITNESGDNYNSAVLWTSGEGDITGFDLAYLISDADVLIELRNDNGTPDYAYLHLEANVPLMLGGSLLGAAAFQSDGTQETDDTHYDTIDRITAKNNTDGSATSNTANVTLVLFE